MKYPKLVPKNMCKTPIKVIIESEKINYDGEPVSMELDLLCNFQDVAKTIFTDEKKTVEITGTALFDGDIAPDMAAISGGTVEVFGEKRRIEKGMKARNPDGSVNYTRLEVV